MAVKRCCGTMSGKGSQSHELRCSSQLSSRAKIVRIKEVGKRDSKFEAILLSSMIGRA